MGKTLAFLEQSAYFIDLRKGKSFDNATKYLIWKVYVLSFKNGTAIVFQILNFGEISILVMYLQNANSRQ